MNSNKKVEIKKQKILLDDYFVVEEAYLKIEKFNKTMSKEMRRLRVNRSDAACILLIDTQTNSILLVNQFRYPAFSKGNGYMIEIPAGIVEKDEDPVQTIIRETWEETGYKIKKPCYINCFYPSSGVSSERCFLYYSDINREDKKGLGGGLDSENEDIEVLWLKTSEIKSKLLNGEIIDAKSIIALQWFLLNPDLVNI